MAAQALLFPDAYCDCGQPAEKAGLCLRHYNAWYHSQRNFGGHRESVIERDAGICRICADVGTVVHHRTYVDDPELQITLCRACHAYIHRSLSLRTWVPEIARTLWAEVHPDAPLQMQFDYAAAQSGSEGASTPSSSLMVYGISAASTSSRSSVNSPLSSFMA